MVNSEVCFSDSQIENVFKTHLGIEDKKELKVVLERFYESYYVRGKSLKVAVNHTVLNNYSVPKVLLDELEQLTSYY